MSTNSSRWRLCDCDWGDDCSSWQKLLSEEGSSYYCSIIGKSPFRLQLTSTADYEKKLRNAKSETKQESIKLKRDIAIGFRKCVLRNINRNAKYEVYKDEDIVVARNHFPHEYQKSKSSPFRLPEQKLTTDVAKKLNIPRDSYNLNKGVLKKEDGKPKKTYYYAHRIS